MTNEEYKYTQDLLMHYSILISQLELDDFIDRISKAEAVGPVLDPTGYKAAILKLEGIKEIAIKARSLKTTMDVHIKHFQEGR